MCTNGMNTNQFKSMIEHIDDQIALDRRWVHRMFHSAEEAGYAETAKTIKEAQSLLDDVRALLTDAQDTLEKDERDSSDVTVKLV